MAHPGRRHRGCRSPPGLIAETLRADRSHPGKHRSDQRQQRCQDRDERRRADLSGDVAEATGRPAGQQRRHQGGEPLHRDNTDLTETDRQAILSAANAIEAQKKANQAATASSKARTKSLQDEVKALDTLIDKALPEKKRLEDLADGVRVLRKAQAEGKITTAEMELGIKNLNEAYADGSIQKRIQQEQKLAEQRRNSSEAYRKAMEVVLQARQDAINSDVAGIGLGMISATRRSASMR